MNDLREYIACVDRVIDYNNIKNSQYHRIYDAVVEYINKNYGVVNISDY